MRRSGVNASETGQEAMQTLKSGAVIGEEIRKTTSQNRRPGKAHDMRISSSTRPALTSAAPREVAFMAGSSAAPSCLELEA